MRRIGSSYWFTPTAVPVVGGWVGWCVTITSANFSRRERYRIYNWSVSRWTSSWAYKSSLKHPSLVCVAFSIDSFGSIENWRFVRPIKLKIGPGKEEKLYQTDQLLGETVSKKMTYLSLIEKLTTKWDDAPRSVDVDFSSFAASSESFSHGKKKRGKVGA